RIKKAEMEKLSLEKKKIEETMWVDYTSDELVEIIADYEIMITDGKTIRRLENERKNHGNTSRSAECIKKELKEKDCELETIKQHIVECNIRKQLYTCPCCEKKLRLVDSALIAHKSTGSDPDDSIDDLKQSMVACKKQIGLLNLSLKNKLRDDELFKQICGIRDSYEDMVVLEEAQEEMRDLLKYKTTQHTLASKLSSIKHSLKHELGSPALISMKKEISDKLVVLSRLEKYSDCVYEEGGEIKLREFISKMKESRRVCNELAEEKERLLGKEKLCIKKRIELLSEYQENFGDQKNVNDIEKEIGESENTIRELENKITIHHSNLAIIEKYNDYLVALATYQKNEDKLSSLTQHEKETRDLYAAATILKTKIAEAESIAMIDIISSINTHAQVFLDYIFQEKPILVNILPFKETKQLTKPRLNIHAEYEGATFDDVGSLSDGEYEKVNVAFTLALAEMFNLPVIVLDEITAQIDQSSTSHIFECIKENFTNKLVVVIAHHIITGSFDTRVEL
ncbi:hypothetical protein KAT92_04995, partial [Candidatus Babeliales bacterium]|nr:hypothetical protein [Candidatus Babeliales bacterium]